MRLTYYSKPFTYLIFLFALSLASQAATDDKPSSKPKPKPSEPEPTLSMTAMDAKGEKVDTATKVTGGISVNKAALQQTATLTVSDTVEIRGTLTVDPKHAGKKAELVVYAGYKPLAATDADKSVFYMLDDKGQVQPWNEERTQLTTFKTIKKLPKKAQKVTIYKGQFLLPGKLQIFFGYRIKDPGKELDNLLVTNATPIDLTINDATTVETPTEPTETPSETPERVSGGDYVVLGFNDLGMHCMQNEYSVFALLPPYNTVHVQVLQRSKDGKLRLVEDDSKIEVRYFPVADANGSINSTSLGKTDFWDYASALFGQEVPKGQGLAGLYMPADTKEPQPMPFRNTNLWFSAPGIPMTPLDDNMQTNPYPLLRFAAIDKQTGETLAATDIVVPVSQEVNCQECHATGKQATTTEPGIKEWASDKDIDVQAKKNILMLHDYRVGTDLLNNTPVLCASCHYSAALDLKDEGPQSKQTGKSNMSAAIHGYHAFIEKEDTSMEKTCYQCHPGKETSCLRGVMLEAGIECRECHGGMEAVAGKYPLSEGGSLEGKNDGNPRRPWKDLPRCQSCHTGDALDHLSGDEFVPAEDGLRLFQAFKVGDDSASPIIATNQRFAEEDNTLYRSSKGHGGVACEGCHGSTHAEWAVLKEEANDNVTATQLQGHSGKLIECDACHTADSLPLTMKGPHGLHNVGDKWVEQGNHDSFFEKDPDSCKACHGEKLEGTVLSRMATDRTFQVEGRAVKLEKGKAVSCDLCHGMPKL